MNDSHSASYAAAGVEAGHFRCLPPHQGALGLTAALGDARHDLGDAAGVVFAAGDVVKWRDKLV